MRKIRLHKMSILQKNKCILGKTLENAKEKDEMSIL